MLDFIKVYCDMGHGHDAESCVLCGACADLLLDGDQKMKDEYGEVMDWERYIPKYDDPGDIYCDHCDECMEEYGDEEDDLSDASDRVPCGYPCGDEPHGCLLCDENPRNGRNGDIDVNLHALHKEFVLMALEGFDE